MNKTATEQVMDMYKQGRIPIEDVDEIAQFEEFLQHVQQGPVDKPMRDRMKETVSDPEWGAYLGLSAEQIESNRVELEKQRAAGGEKKEAGE